MPPTDPTAASWVTFAALHGAWVRTDSATPHYAAPSAEVDEALRGPWVLVESSTWSAPSTPSTVAVLPARAALEWTAAHVAGLLHYTLTAASEFSERVILCAAPWVWRWLRWLDRIVAAVRTHLPRLWALLRLEPLALAGAIHAPPAMGMFRLGGPRTD